MGRARSSKMAPLFLLRVAECAYSPAPSNQTKARPIHRIFLRVFNCIMACSTADALLCERLGRIEEALQRISGALPSRRSRGPPRNRPAVVDEAGKEWWACKECGDHFLAEEMCLSPSGVPSRLCRDCKSGRQGDPEAQERRRALKQQKRRENMRRTPASSAGTFVCRTCHRSCPERNMRLVMIGGVAERTHRCKVCARPDGLTSGRRPNAADPKRPSAHSYSIS